MCRKMVDDGATGITMKSLRGRGRERRGEEREREGERGGRGREGGRERWGRGREREREGEGGGREREGQFLIRHLSVHLVVLQARQGNASAKRPDFHECYYCYYWFDYYTTNHIRCTAWHSPSQSYLMLDKMHKPVKVRLTEEYQ